MAEAEGDILISLFSQTNLADYMPRSQPLIIFEDFRSGGTRLPNGNGLFYLSQPFGPHKFGRVLGSCLEYHSAIPEVEKDLEAFAVPSLDPVSMVSDATRTEQSTNPMPALSQVLERFSIGRPGLSRSPSYLEPHPIGYSSNHQNLGPELLTALEPVSIATSEPKARSIVLLVSQFSFRAKPPCYKVSSTLHDWHCKNTQITTSVQVIVGFSVCRNKLVRLLEMTFLML